MTQWGHSDPDEYREKNLNMKIFLTFVLVIFIFSNSVFAKGEFLKIVPGALEVSMGETGTSIYGNLSASALNPASLAFLRRDELTTTYLSHFTGINYGYLAGSKRLSKRSTIAPSIIYLGTSEDIRDTIGTKTGDAFSYYGAVYSVAYSIRIGRIVGIGITPKFAQEKLENYSNSFCLLDFGGFVRLGNFSLGISETNLGLDDSGDWTGKLLRYVVSGSYQKGKLTCSIDSGPRAEKFFSSFGLRYKISSQFNLSAGANFTDENIFLKLKSVKYSGGLGFEHKDYRMDYAIVPYRDLGLTHRIAVSYHFGKYRIPEEKHITAEAEPITLEKGTHIAVIDFEAKEPISQSEALFVADLFRGALVESRYFKVVERRNMETILAEQGFQQTGCTTTECAVQIGKILNVQKMVVGSFGKLGEFYILPIRIVDVETGQIVYSAKVSCKNLTPDEIENMVKELVSKMVTR